MKKETKQNLGKYTLTAITMYAFSLLFSLLSLIFIIDKIPSWLKFVVSFIFIVPILYISFLQGKSSGEKLFKARAKTTLSNLHAEEAIAIPYHRCVYHVLGFVVPLLFVLIFAVIFDNGVLRLILYAFEFPAALLFSSVGVLPLHTASPIMLAVFIPYTLIVAGMFVLGYLLKAYRLKRQHADIESEIRMFDN